MKSQHVGSAVKVVMVAAHATLDPILEGIKEGGTGPLGVLLGSVCVGQVDDGNEVGLIDTNEKNVVAVLARRDCSHEAVL